MIDEMKQPCSDCGEGPLIVKYCGPLLPEGKTGLFCHDCFSVRIRADIAGMAQKPLGHKMQTTRQLQLVAT